MASVVFTRNLRRHVDIERCEVTANTVAQALSEIFEQHSRLRGYLLDDTGALRTHIAILINGQSISDRHHQSDPLPDDADMFVVQTLSGG